jgi:hypothetical protein
LSKMPRPVPVSTVIRQDSPRKCYGANRYELLRRDNSPAPESPGFRQRTNSVKRKEPEEPSFAEIASKSVRTEVPVICIEETAELTVEIVKTRSLCDNIAEELNAAEIDPAVVTIFGNMLEVMRNINNTQGKIVEKLEKNAEAAPALVPAPRPVPAPAQYPRPQSTMTNLGAIPKNSRQAYNGGTLPGKSAGGPGTGGSAGGSALGSGHRPPISSVINAKESVTEDPKISKFKEAIQCAERSTLVFNLDMGKVPVMNKETMSRRASRALSSMAAKIEKRTGRIPSAETVDALDDVLSLTSDMEFFGKETKTYRNPKDDDSGAFCTVPVKYEFEDRDIKTKAEKVLRKRCGAKCGTPYPIVVRECIKQIVDNVKGQFPGHFVRVNIDLKNMLFKVSRKPPDDAADPGWKYMKVDIPIPQWMSMHVKCRRVSNLKSQKKLPMRKRE